jgi:hypothetical protein
MSRLKILFSVVLLVVCTYSASAFSLQGPYAPWQTAILGYQRVGQGGGPMFLGEEYRWNIPIITYGFDPSFAEYFGVEGMAAIDEAFQILNSFPAASAISDADVSQNTSIFPEYVMAENSQAGALGLYDLKSTALQMLMFEMGLDSPELWVYTLRSRDAGNDPDYTNWYVITMNYDPVTLEPINVINNVLYFYDGIVHMRNPDGDRPNVVQITLEPNAGTVAGGRMGRGNFYPGTEATSALTRDDAGGLRYLLSPSRLNVEELLPGTDEIWTNTTSPIVITNYDLGLFIRDIERTTNTAAELFALYPGIILTSTNSFFSNVVTTNISTFFTNYPYALGEDPYAEENVVWVEDIETDVVEFFNYSVGNVVTNFVFPGRTTHDRTVNILPAVDYTPGGNQILTNIISEFDIQHEGTIFIRPPNLLGLLITATNQMSERALETNLVFETVSANLAVTNTNVVMSVSTVDLNVFLRNTRKTTNTVAQVLALYPDLFITQTNSRLGLLAATNITSHITNYPWMPTQIFVTNITYEVVTYYDYTVGNVLGKVANDPIMIEPEYYAPYSLERDVWVELYDVVPAMAYTPGLPAVTTNYHEGYPAFETEFAEIVQFGDPLDFVNIEYAFGEAMIVPTNYLSFSYLSHVLRDVSYVTNIDYFITADMVVVTNMYDLDLLETHDLTRFTDQARTNTPADLLVLYPKLLILQSNDYHTNIISTNYISYFTNSAWDPAGTLVLTQMAILTTNVATNYNYVFGNVVTNGIIDGNIANPPGGPWVDHSGYLIVEEQIVATPPYSPAGSPPTTNITVTRIETNVPVGNIYIVPTNQFGWYIHSVQHTNILATTNTYTFTNFFFPDIQQTNTVHYIRWETNYALNVFPIQLLSSNEVATNIFGTRKEVIAESITNTWEVNPVVLLTTNDLATNIFGMRRETIEYFTPTVLTCYPVEARDPDPNAEKRPGVDKINFVKAEFDEFIGPNLFYTNSYAFGGTNVIFPTVPVFTNMIIYTNHVHVSNVVHTQTLRRTITIPDIVFYAGDLGVDAFGNPFSTALTYATGWRNHAALNTRDTGSLQGGPGVIPPSVGIYFSKLAPFYFNQLSGSDFLQGTEPLGRWASFGASTNITIYPIGTSIHAVEQENLNP